MLPDTSGYVSIPSKVCTSEQCRCCSTCIAHTTLSRAWYAAGTRSNGCIGCLLVASIIKTTLSCVFVKIYVQPWLVALSHTHSILVLVILISFLFHDYDILSVHYSFNFINNTSHYRTHAIPWVIIIVTSHYSTHFINSIVMRLTLTSFLFVMAFLLK